MADLKVLGRVRGLWCLLSKRMRGWDGRFIPTSLPTPKRVESGLHRVLNCWS